MKQFFIIGLVIVAIMLSACSEENTRRPNIYNSPIVQNDSVLSSNSLRTENIFITNLGFIPASLTIQKGTTVVWTNDDTVKHSVVSNIGRVDSQDILPGEKYEYTFTKEGTYNYHCSIHPSLEGTIIVKDD